MVKLVFCCRRRPELSLEQFQKRWLEVHGPLVRRLREQIPQMKRYVQSHTIPGEPSEMLRASRGAKPPYDGITEVWFDSLERSVHRARPASTPRGACTRTRPSSSTSPTPRCS